MGVNHKSIPLPLTTIMKNALPYDQRGLDIPFNPVKYTLSVEFWENM